MTPADRLRAMAEEEEKRAAELEDSLPAIRAAIEAHRAGAAGMRKLAAEMDGTKEQLHTRSHHARINDVNDTARLNMSRSNSDDPFVKACRAKGLTQNDVAKRLKIPRSLLSMYRSGVRRIPQDRAEAIEVLTGWKATPKNWPGGILAAD